jgi:putative peptidoglycan lipid II flippase
MIAGRIYRASGLMTIATALSRVTGLVRVAAMTYALGVTATRLADTYNLANTTPNIVYELVLGGVFTAVFVPVLVEIRTTERGSRSALVTVSMIVLAVASILTAVAAPLVIRIYTFRIADPATRAAQLQLATYLLRWFAPQIFFYGVWSIAQALLNVRGRFGPPAFTPVVNNVAVTAMFVAYARVIGQHGLHISPTARVTLGAGTTAGVVLQAILLVPYLRGDGLRFRARFTDPAVRRVAKLSAFVVGYVVINQIGFWVVLALANGRRGGVTAFTIAFMFFQVPHALFAVSLLTALFPDISQAAADGDWDAYRGWFASGVRGVAYLLLPATAGYLLLARPITRLILARGFANAHDALLVAGVLQALTIGLIFFSLFQLLTRSFYALHDTRTPTALNAVAVAVNTGINFPLFAWLGVAGLGYAQSIAYAVGAALLAWRLAVRVPGGLRLQELARPIGRMLAAAAAMGAIVALVALARPFDDALTVTIAVLAGAILYLAFSQVAGIEERELLLVIFRRTRGGRET